MSHIYRATEGVLIVSYRMRFSEILEGVVLHVDRCRLEEWGNGFQVVSLDTLWLLRWITRIRGAGAQKSVEWMTELEEAQPAC